MIKNNKLLFLVLTLIISFTLIGCGVDKEKNTNTKNKETSVSINKKESYVDVEGVVEYICSDEIGYKSVEDKGNELAVKYINNLFSNMNLEYVFGESYLHEFIYKNKGYSANGNLIDEQIELNNIVGKISGKDNKKAIVITAHIDSFGKGVLDNASGVAVALKMADILKNNSKNNLPDQDIIFCITNAEMQLFVGSENFVNDIKEKYESLCNVNIDCIGLKTGGPLALKNISNISESEKLYESLKKNLTESNIEFSDIVSSEKVEMTMKMNSGVSDYVSFEKLGIPNIHISQSEMGSLPDKQNAGLEILDYQYLNKFAIAMVEWLQDFQIK
ncbi:hypothetical protein UT300019_25440 [Clostridium sp. CTA-19]